MQTFIRWTVVIILFIIITLTITIINNRIYDKIQWSFSNWVLMLIIAFNGQRFYNWLFKTQS